MQKLHNFTWWLRPNKENRRRSKMTEDKIKTLTKMKANKDTQKWEEKEDEVRRETKLTKTKEKYGKLK